MAYKKDKREIDLWDRTQDLDERVRAEAFGALAEMKFNASDYATSYTCAVQSQELYQSIGDSFGLAEGYYFEGRALRGQKEYAGAAEKLKLAVDTFRANANEYFLAAVLFEQGITYDELKQWSLAKMAYESAATLWETNEQWQEAADSFDNAGTALMELREYAQAELCFRKALDCFSNTEQPFNMAQAQKNLGNALYAQFNYEAAEDAYQKAVHIADYTNIEGFIGFLMLHLADTKIRLAKLDEASELISKAREQISGPYVMRHMGFADLLDARVLYEQGVYDSAIPLLQRVITAFSSMKNEEWLLDARNWLARVHIATGNPLLAAEQFDLLFTEAETRQMQDHTPYVAAAQCQVALGNSSEALELLQRVDQLRLPNEASMVEANSTRARVFLLNEMPTEAIALARQTRETLAHAATEYELGHLAETEGRALVALGEVAAGIDVLSELLLAASLNGQQEIAQRAAQWISQARETSIAPEVTELAATASVADQATPKEVATQTLAETNEVVSSKAEQAA